MGSNYQVLLVNGIANMQTVLNNKQATDAEAGSIATDLSNLEYDLSIVVLDEDAANLSDIAEAGNKNGWTDADTDAYNAASQVYQNDTAVCQTGQSNATNSVQQEQTQVSQDSTNLANVLSLSSILSNIGQYMIGILERPYK